MSWSREPGGGKAAIAAATATGVLADDSRELEKIRALGMSPRQLALNHLWSRFRALQYESRSVEWDGAEATSAVEREMMASAPTVPPGFYASAESTPLRFRKPSAPYHLFRVIVQRFSDLLFAEARNPRVTCPGDPVKEEFANGLIESTRLWSHMSEARNYGGSCGSAVVGFSFVEGRPLVEVFEPFYCFPKFKSRSTMDLEKIEIRWMYPVEERDDKGKWQTIAMWYRRIIDEQNDTVWEAVRAPKDKDGHGTKEPDWSAPENEPEVSAHGFGFCPVRWIQNTKVQGEPEGEFDCTGALEMIDRMDHLLAQGLQGVDLNCDPTLMFEGTEDTEIPEVKKGSFNAIKLPKGSAKYLELVGSGPKTAMEWVQTLRGWVLEMCQCVLEDPDAGGESAMTATEVLKRYASMHARAGKLREQYGQNGFLPLLEMMIRAARTQAAGRVAAPEEPGGIVKGQVVVPPAVEKDDATGTVTLRQRPVPQQDTGAMLQAVWPEWFDPTPQDAQVATTAASAALLGGLIDLDHAVRYIAPFYKVEDAAGLAATLKQAKADEQAQQQQQLMAGMGPVDDGSSGGPMGGPGDGGAMGGGPEGDAGGGPPQLQ